MDCMDRWVGEPVDLHWVVSASSLGVSVSDIKIPGPPGTSVPCSCVRCPWTMGRSRKQLLQRLEQDQALALVHAQSCPVK